ncbi:MAG: hypothetical protein RL695_2045 [Pseudomonadota bacterium]|jgi:hypothetical protein
MKMKAIAAAMSLAGLFGAQSALAEVTYDFSGFGTLSAVHSNTRAADFRGSITQPNGPGASSSTMFGVDTKLGGQAVANLGNGFSATAQVIADHRADNSYAPQFEWANLKYQINDTVYVRAGRVVAPVFMTSDFRNVGYTQITVRPAYEIYMNNPITHLDGVDVGARFNVAGGILSTQLTGGRFKLLTQSNGDIIDVRGSAKIFNVAYEKDSNTFRFGYTRTKSNADGSSLATLRSALNLFGYTSSDLSFRNMNTDLYDFGYLYDDSKWVAQAEYILARSQGPSVQDGNAWSALLGYRVGKFTPYVGHARITSKEEATPAGLHPVVTMIYNRVNTHYQQNTTTLGLRYDVYKNVALKAQLDHIKKPSLASGLNRGGFTNVTTAFMQESASVNLYTVALDFVF